MRSSNSPHSTSYDLLITSGCFSMKTESNRRVNSCTQRMARNDFPLPSHLSALPLVSQSDKHYKEPMFLHVHLFCYFSFMHHFLST